MGVAFDATDAQYLVLPAAAVNRATVDVPVTIAFWATVPTLGDGDRQIVVDSVGDYGTGTPLDDGGVFAGFWQDGTDLYLFYAPHWQDAEDDHYFNEWSELLSGYGVEADDFIHVALVCSTTGIQAYINGVAGALNAPGDGQYNPSPTNAPVFLVGCEISSGSPVYHYTGTVADLRVFSRALSADEIATLAAERGATVILEDCEGWWPMSGPDGADASAASAVEDISGNGRHSDSGAGTVDVPRWAAAALRTAVG